MPGTSQAQKAKSRAGQAGPPGISPEGYYHLLDVTTCRSWRPVSVALLTTRIR